MNMTRQIQAEASRQGASPLCVIPGSRLWQGVCVAMGMIFGLYLGAMAVSLAVGSASALPLMGLLAGLMGLTACGLWRVTKGASALSKAARTAFYALAGLLTLWAQAGFALSLYAEYGWDIAYSLQAGANLLDVGTDVHYLSVYPNNIAVSLLYGWAFWWAADIGLNDYMLVLTAINLLVADTAILLGARLAWHCLGRGGCAAYLILSLGLVAFNPWMAVPYTDTLTLIFPPLILLLWERSRQATLPRALGWWALMGLAAGLGYLIKPTALIALIAVFFLSFFLQRKAWRSWARGLLLSCVALAVVIGVTQAFYLVCYTLAPGELNHETLEANSVPMTHFLMMGLTENGDIIGGWNGDDVSATEAIPGKAAKVRYNLETAQARLQAMGLGGYIRHLWLKSRFIWNDGTFYYGGEGRFYEFYNRDDPVSQALQSFYGLDGAGHPLYQSGADALWLMVLCLMAVGGLRRDQPPLMAAARLTVMGLGLFLLLFEARSRYLINHLPLCALLAAQGAGAMGEAWRKARKIFPFTKGKYLPHILSGNKTAG